MTSELAIGSKGWRLFDTVLVEMFCAAQEISPERNIVFCSLLTVFAAWCGEESGASDSPSFLVVSLVPGSSHAERYLARLPLSLWGKRINGESNFGT